MLGWVITCHDERAQDMLLETGSQVWSAATVSRG